MQLVGFKLIILFEKFICISVSQFLTINISIQEKFEDTKGAFSSGNSNKKSYNGQKKTSTKIQLLLVLTLPYTRKLLRTKLYNKRDDFNCPIVDFPFIYSDISAAH
jgi:hypothetical protein